METKKNSYIKTGFKEALSRFKIVSLPLSFFAILTIGILILGFYFPITLLLTVPFVVIPSFFSVGAINTVAKNENTHEALGFFIMFKTYFSQFFRGGYKVIISFLKSLLVFVIFSVVLSTIFTLTIIAKDPAFIELQAITDPEQLVEALNNFIETNETFNLTTKITYMCASTGFFCMFIHNIGINSVKVNFNFLAKFPLPTSDLNLVNKMVMKKVRKNFRKDYFKTFWFLGLIIFAGFVGGSLLAYFFLKEIYMQQIPVVGALLAFILALFFIPYFLNASQALFLNYQVLYIDTLIDLSKQSLEELKKTQKISEEKEKEVMKMIESEKIDKENNKKDKDSN